ncbi:hypothetical protein [Carnobacterium maltaromaticum]|uniref:hypothetical protein n=1 Tax=Carnobacterium maltaromaticum TaxID=2751 RepID=UPI00026C8A54|nr:hypothetical protein [Carnobacterium maltaromaticum]
MADKPPIGLIPRHIHNRQRLSAIEEAIDYYIEASKTIPAEWITEYCELVKMVHGANATINLSEVVKFLSDEDIELNLKGSWRL